MGATQFSAFFIFIIWRSKSSDSVWRKSWRYFFLNLASLIHLMEFDFYIWTISSDLVWLALTFCNLHPTWIMCPTWIMSPPTLISEWIQWDAPPKNRCSVQLGPNRFSPPPQQGKKPWGTLERWHRICHWERHTPQVTHPEMCADFWT